MCGKGGEEWNCEEKLDNEMSRFVRLKIAKWKKSEWKVGLDVSMCVQPVRVSDLSEAKLNNCVGTCYRKNLSTTLAEGNLQPNQAELNTMAVRPVSTNLNVNNFNISSSANPGINILEDEKIVVENTQALSLFEYEAATSKESKTETYSDQNLKQRRYGE